MNIQEKVNLFQKSCQTLLERDVTELNKAIDLEIEKQIKDELQEYQEKEEMAYRKKLEKLEKDYNKQIYSLEMENKKDVLEQKKQIQKDLKKEIIQTLKNFTQTPEYKEFLFCKIEETTEKLESTEYSVLGLVALDQERYGTEIESKYHLEIQKIDDRYVGGCILEDKMEGLYMDNTLLNSIDESLEKKKKELR